jgi:hypothetical protein
MSLMREAFPGHGNAFFVIERELKRSRRIFCLEIGISKKVPVFLVGQKLYDSNDKFVAYC